MFPPYAISTPSGELVADGLGSIAEALERARTLQQARPGKYPRLRAWGRDTPGQPVGSPEYASPWGHCPDPDATYDYPDGAS